MSLQMKEVEGGLDSETFKGPFQPKDSMEATILLNGKSGYKVRRVKNSYVIPQLFFARSSESGVTDRLLVTAMDLRVLGRILLVKL